MKKITIALVLLVILTGSLFAQDRLTLDLTKLSLTRNPVAFTRQYDWYPSLFGAALPANVDWTRFNKAIIRVQCFRADGTSEIRQGYGNVVCSIFYEAPAGATADYIATRREWDGAPNVFEGRNVALKVDNLGMTGPANVSRDAGASVSFARAPAGIMMQNASAAVRFIEIKEITFFRE